MHWSRFRSSFRFIFICCRSGITQELKHQKCPRPCLNSSKSNRHADPDIGDVEEHSTPKHERVFETNLKRKKAKVKKYAGCRTALYKRVVVWETGAFKRAFRN